MTAKSRSARCVSPPNAASRFASTRCSCTPSAPSRIARTNPARRPRFRSSRISMAAEIALPHGYALHEYRVEETLGIGGFGLTYLATDSNLNLKVAIKEYLPGDLAQRGEDQSVQPKAESSSESFKWGLSRFLDESRTLASFRHPNIVRVLRFFEANRTAYMVMEFVAGQPLGEWIRTRRPLEQSAVLAIAIPLLDGLEVIHRTGYLHRDIKPGNVVIREDGSPVLPDFRSARTASQPTVKIQDPLQATAPPTTLPTGVEFDRDTLKRIEAELAKHIGPIASVMIKTAAKKAYTIAALAEIVSVDIADDKERAAFVRRFSGDKSTPTGDPTRAGATRQQSVPPAASNIDAETLARAEAALAKYIGAVAKVVVKRAAAKARDPGELFLLIAEEIEDKNERKTFIRKAISASGKE